MKFIPIKYKPTKELIDKYQMVKVEENEKELIYKLYTRCVSKGKYEELLNDIPEIKEIKDFFDLRAIKLTITI